MQVTHTITYGPRKAKENLTVTLTDADLTEVERGTPTTVWGMLLAIKAEKQVLITKKTIGLLKADEATKRSTELDAVYKSLLSLRK